MLETMGWISIVPVALAVILAFATRNTIASLATACILGCFLVGKGIFRLGCSHQYDGWYHGCLF